MNFLVTALADVADEADERGLKSTSDDLTSLLLLISKFAEMQKKSYIKEIKENGKTKYEVKSEKNPNWSGGTYSSKEKAEERLKEVEMFKHMNKD
jgi:hypothetical protein